MTLSASRALWPAPFVDQRGNRRPGLTITVYELGTGPAPDGDGSLVLAELFVDDALTTPGPNPVTTDAGGNETSIKAAAGYYDAVVDGETIRMLVLDPASAVQARGGGGEVVATIANAGSAATLNLADANVFVVENPTAGGTCVLTLTGATAGRSCGGTLYFHQRASGDSALAFAGGTVLHMNDGDLPGPAQVADAVSVYGWATLDGDATIYVWKVGDSGTVAPPAVPAAPTAVVGTRGNAQVSVAFTPGAANGAAISGYTVTASPGGATATGSASPIVVPGLTNGTAYTFTVHATNSEGDSPESSPSAAVTPATVPGAPTAVVGTPGNTSASIAFSAPGSNGGAAITGYTATLSPGGATFSGASSPITASGLTNGQMYTATVHAANAVGPGTESSASAGFTPAVGPSVPDAPTIGTATAGDGTATGTWTAGGNGGSAIIGYDWEMVLSSDGTTVVDSDSIGVALTTGPVTAANGTAVKFRARAVNIIGPGAWSALSNAVTPAGFTPEAYSNLVDWIEPEEMVSPPADGTAIASMPNLHSGGQTYAQATGAKQPVYKASVAAFNGKAVLRFDVANAQILDTAAPVSTLTAGYTHIWVASTASTSAERCVGFNGDRNASGCGLYPCSGSGTAPGKVSILQGGTAWQDTSPAVTPSSTPSIYMSQRDGTTGVTTLYINGVPTPITNSSAASGVVPSTHSSIGGDGTFFHDGDVGLKLTYNIKRSKAELNAIGNAYATKYGHPWTDIP